jgi:hypothetical protein
MSQNKSLYKIGGITGILGALGNNIGNILHPATLPSQSGQDRLLEIAHSAIWYPTHVLILLSVVCFAVSFLALYHYLLDKHANKTFTQIGLGFAFLGTAISCVLLPIDGFTIKRAADLWFTAVENKVLLFHLSALLEQIDLDLFSMFLFMYYGLTFIFFGLAAYTSELKHKNWHLLPAVSGLILAVTAIYQLVFTATNWTIAIWIPIWTIQSVWLGILGYTMYRFAE